MTEGETNILDIDKSIAKDVPSPASAPAHRKEPDKGGFYWGTGRRKSSVARVRIKPGDGKMIILDEDGNLALATVTPQGMTVHSKCKVAQRYAWATPTLVGTTLYVRDRKHILALDLG